ncbi:glycogen synthase GlgA [bacterium]|nr:glycogen synthase GlgA [bacterium]
MNIVYLTSEAIPFAKTGGLGDVGGTLPTQLASMGHHVSVILPAFQSIYSAGIEIAPTDISFAISMRPGKVVGCRLLRSKLPGSAVTVWFLDQPQYFDRDSLYGSTETDFPDNAERFTFFNRAAVQAIHRLELNPEIIHCNDWQTGLVPGLLKYDPSLNQCFRDTASLITIHNLAYQGHFPAQCFELTGLSWDHFHPNSFEFYNHLNFLKAGIISSDMVTTVSPQYAKEITTQQHGCGLDGVLRSVSNRLIGITNGIDESIWNPATDPAITVNYDVSSWREGKASNKQALQKRLGLEQNLDVPLIGLVGRLAAQKGWDLVLPVLRWHLSERRPTQWAVLGSGDPRYERELRELSNKYPEQFALHVGFSDNLAHQIEASSDLFLMPSHYEPCGLNQLYSLRYGSIPIVNPTGGLADTVINASTSNIQNNTATGFHLERPHPRALDEALGKALHLKYHQPKDWSQIVETGMSQDWSWHRSAEAYLVHYKKTIARKKRKVQSD